MAVETEPRARVDERGGTEEDVESEFDRDELFHLLQNERRRRALDYLRGREGPVRMRDIVDHVAAAEHDTTPEALRSDERKRVHIALYQSHLPKLDQAGVLDYNQDRGTVTRTDRAAELDRFLAVGAVEGSTTGTTNAASTGAPATAPSSTNPSWHAYYLALAAFSLLLVTVSVVFSVLVTPTTAAITVAVAFAALTVADWIRKRNGHSASLH